MPLHLTGPFLVSVCHLGRTLLQQLQKLQALVMGKVSRTCKLAGTQTGTCLMVSFPKGLPLASPPISRLPYLENANNE